jgi:hypothetical protein
MDEAAQAIATAALTLQSVLLQTLVQKGVLSREGALGIVDRSLEAAANATIAEDGEVPEITRGCLAGVREGLAAMATRQ